MRSHRASSARLIQRTNVVLLSGEAVAVVTVVTLATGDHGAAISPLGVCWTGQYALVAMIIRRVLWVRYAEKKGAPKGRERPLDLLLACSFRNVCP